MYVLKLCKLGKLSQTRYLFAAYFLPAVVAMAYGRDLNNLSFAGLMGMWDPPREKVHSEVCMYTTFMLS